MRSSRKEHLVETALKLFYQDGFHATGIDKILKEAGVAKMTLYKHFRSKDDLILATLQERDRRFREWFLAEVEARAEKPQDKMLAVFDTLEVWFHGDFRGCMFINASAEFSGKNPDIHQFSAEHKNLMLGYLEGLAEAAGASDPKSLACQLNILAEGSIVVAHVCEDKEAAAKAKVAAALLIREALAA